MSRKSRRRRKAAKNAARAEAPPGRLTWRVHPFAENGTKSAVAIAAVLGMGGLALWVSWDLGAHTAAMFGAGAAVIMFLAMHKFFLPTTYVLSKDLIEIRRVFHSLEADWERGEYVSVGEAVERLLEAEERVGRGVLDGDTLMVGAARIGWEDQLILADRAENLAKTDFGRPPHVLVVPGSLHFMEAEALKALAGCPEEILREGARTLRTTAEVVRRYLRSVDRVLGEVRRSAETLDERAKGVFEEAERYFMDAKHYFDRGDLTTALSAVAYSEGLLDALRMMGLIEFRW